ncbi:MAG: isoprenoid biosynthesis glyoxalase ElbB [Phycisphaerales bacterium]
MSKVAVVLSGCGYLDGSEIHEAVSVLVHLSRHGAAVSCFAPDIRVGAVDHVTGKPMDQQRSVLVESARIARGKIGRLSELRASNFDAVVFPGGFGAAKNLCNFAEAGAACVVNPEVERVVKEFHASGKPVGMCCIAPVIGARVLGKRAGGPGVRVTVGSEGGASHAVEEMGASHVVKPVTQSLGDEVQGVYTSPAYMYGEAKPHEVFEGIGAMIDQVMSRAGR